MTLNEIAESIEQPEATPVEADEVELEEVEEEEDEPQDDVADLKKKIATLEAQKDHWRKKASEKVEKAEEPQPVQSNLSLADLRAIASVHEDDVERVERYARAEGVSIREALKDPELKAILSLREETRNTASATNVSNSRRSSGKVSEATLIANAQSGKLPDDDDGIARLIAAKRKLKS